MKTGLPQQQPCPKTGQVPRFQNLLGGPSGNRKRELVKRFHAVWSTGQVEELEQLLSPQFYYHFNAGSDWKGIEGTGEKIRGLRKAFPDWREEIVNIITEEDKVVTRYRSTATHRGTFYGLDSADG